MPVGVYRDFEDAPLYFNRVYTDNEPDDFVVEMPEDPSEIEAPLKIPDTLEQAERLADMGPCPEPVPSAASHTRELDAKLRDEEKLGSVPMHRRQVRSQ